MVKSTVNYLSVMQSSCLIASNFRDIAISPLKICCPEYEMNYTILILYLLFELRKVFWKVWI